MTGVDETAFGGVLRNYYSIACNHCDDPACMAICPMEAISIADFDTIDESLYEKTVPGFPDISATNPNVRFLVPKAGEQSRR